MEKTKVVGGEKRSGLGTKIFKIGRREPILEAFEDPKFLLMTQVHVLEKTK